MVDLEYHIDDVALVPIDLYFVAKLPTGLNAIAGAYKVATDPCCCKEGGSIGVKAIRRGSLYNIWALQWP